MTNIQIEVTLLPSERYYRSVPIQTSDEQIEKFKEDFVDDNTGLRFQTEEGKIVCFSPATLKNSIKEINYVKD